MTTPHDPSDRAARVADVRHRLPAGTPGVTVAGRILLARHGETEAKHRRMLLGRHELALTDEGRRQAEELAAIVAGDGIVRLYASPLGRTVETAEIVAARIGVQPILDERLTETDKGRWEGRLRADVKAAAPELYRSLRREPETFRFPGGESLIEHQLRVRAALSDIARSPLPALVVAHDGTIRCALALGHHRGLAAFGEPKVPNARPIPFDTRWLGDA
ncbi:MAG: 2,3-bisphosphoglycerate-dependent phosphoglycerate mutase [Solirubrobacteraceae bacterium]|nr:2,3-bisphosphoglycerate-dependent phosphoglycerate mutase [Solirubrobacteraceae bacterium]